MKVACVNGHVWHAQELPCICPWCRCEPVRMIVIEKAGEGEK